MTVPQLTLVLAMVFIVGGCSPDVPIPPAPPTHADGTLTAKGAAWAIRNEQASYDLEMKDLVFAATIAKSGQWYLNFGAAYPNQDITVWIPKSYTRKGRQDWFLGLEGKTVRINGRVSAYKGKPEIVINDLDLIEVTPQPVIEPRVVAKPVVEDQPKVEVATSKPAVVSKEAAPIKTTPIEKTAHTITEPYRPINTSGLPRTLPHEYIFITSPTHSLDQFGYRHNVRCKLFKASEKCNPKAGSSGCSYCRE